MILYGKHGWKGKGTLMEAFLGCLGPLGVAIDPDIFLETKAAKNPDAPTSTIMSWKGKRIIVTSETNEGQKFSASLMKKYSSIDTLTGRSPHDKEPTSFTPSHTIYIQTNKLPYAPANDEAFWNRLHVLCYYWSFVHNPTESHQKKIDINLDDKLKKEAPAICAWMVRGYHAYVKAGGLNPPEECEAFKNKYKFNNDLVGQWIAESCLPKKEIEATSKETFKDLHGNFKAWYLSNIGDKTPSGIWFSKQLDEKGCTRSTGGIRYFYGIQLKSLCDEL